MNKTLVSVIIVILFGLGIYFLLNKEPKVIPQNIDNTPVVAGKIDIAAVCEGALAYMSFPNGEEADKFVKDCIVGNHPEVIEKYIKSLDFSGANI